MTPLSDPSNSPTEAELQALDDAFYRGDAEELCDPEIFARTTALAELLIRYLETMGRAGAESLFTKVEADATVLEIGDRGFDLNTGSMWFQVIAPITGELRRVTIELYDEQSHKLYRALKGSSS
ncbi:MAG TPA: hypothetical protein VG348_15810 [Acidimicrobiia bacterium]|jgi:hypothetical protein|nr:hypothetical protein [Acidimicrobiia bacterium]